MGEVDALYRIYLHNLLAKHEVSKEGGRIAKYLGDGVLATFNARTGTDHAVNAASALIRKLSAKNSKISTRVVVHLGDVHLWSYSKEKKDSWLDPQGISVDILFRLSKLTPASHIMVTEEAVGKSGIVVGEHHYRTVAVRGVDCSVRIAMLGKDKTAIRDPHLKYEIDLRNSRETWDPTLNQMVGHMLRKDWTALENLIKNLKLPLSEHQRALVLYYRALSKGGQGVVKPDWKAVEDANDLLKQAIQLSPENPNFHLNVGYLLLMKEVENENSRRPLSRQSRANIVLAQEFSRNALHLRYEEGDWRSSSVRKVLNNMAYCHYLIAKRGVGKERTIEKAKGLKICEEIEQIRKLIPTNHDFETLDTWGVLLGLYSQSPSTLQKAYDMLVESQRLRKQVGEPSHLVAQHQMEVLKQLAIVKAKTKVNGSNSS